ncbi:hypothetical protein ATANTOWER_022610, partial [Ataeniobius toweri]|nr:hypothetical protein [Ataeniobius toweri]
KITFIFYIYVLPLLKPACLLSSYCNRTQGHVSCPVQYVDEEFSFQMCHWDS